MSLERVGNGVDFDRSSFERREEIDIFRKRGRSTPRVTISFPNDSLPHTQLPEFRKVPYRITKLYHMYIYIYIPLRNSSKIIISKLSVELESKAKPEFCSTKNRCLSEKEEKYDTCVMLA